MCLCKRAIAEQVVGTARPQMSDATGANVELRANYIRLDVYVKISVSQ